MPLRNPTTSTRLVREPLIDTPAAAKLIGVSVGFLEHARTRGDGPAFVVVSKRRIRYRPEAIEAWLSGRERRSTAEGR
jgi:hypothetical protein